MFLSNAEINVMFVRHSAVVRGHVELQRLIPQISSPQKLVHQENNAKYRFQSPLDCMSF